MKTMKRFLIASMVLGTVSFATINVVVNEKSPIGSNLTLQNLEAFTNESSESGGGNSPADNANNSSGWLWRSYFMNCTIAEKLVVNSACGSFTANAVFYSNTVTLQAQITACGGSYTYTTNEPGLKKYCIDGWSFCLSNTNCR
ncbi:MAG: hypothetical protein LBE13_18410 [Bacteroidales bacterium]|nr:hypothetical protein [Bacteroidales bacterium]